MKKLILILLLIAPIQANAVIINPGENAVFTFDFGSLDLSLANAITYTVSASNPDGGGAALVSWTTGSLDLFDELGGSPKNFCCGDYASSFSSGFTNANAGSVYFDDAVSYITISSFVGGLLDGGSTIGAIEISWTATASGFNLPGIAPSFSVDGSALVSIPEVPAPAAIWLFGTALIGLVGFGKRRNITWFK